VHEVAGFGLVFGPAAVGGRRVFGSGERADVAAPVWPAPESNIHLAYLLECSSVLAVAGDLRPVGGRDYPRTYQEFRSWFPDEWRCREYLGGLRWPYGFSCPGCGSGGYWRTGAGLWMCAECGLKTSATAGTIFHRSHTPLSTWFAAIWFVTSQKNGVSARGLQDALGFGFV